MGTGPSRREPEVHVVVVQSQENGKVNAKVLKQAYSSVRRTAADSREQDTPLEDRRDHTQSHTYIHHSTSPDPVRPRYTINRSPPVPKRLSLPGPSSQGRLGSVPHTASTPQLTPDALRVASLNTPVETHKHGRHNPGYHGNHHATSSGYLGAYSTATIAEMESRGQVGGVTAGGRSGEREEDLSPVNDKGGNVFELFRTYDGEEYTVYVREDGKRFYVDWEEEKYRYFPSSWKDRGYFLPMDYQQYQSGNNPFLDTRTGEFIHPTRGKLMTFLRQESLNVLYFFDESSGSWLPMPLSWERHVPSINAMISEVQKSCLNWKDAKSIVALLRLCDYSVDECISMYNSINDDGVLDYSEGSGRDLLRAQTEKRLMETSSLLNETKERNRELRTQIEILQNRIEELEVESENMKKELDIGKREQKRKSMVYRQQSYSYSSRLVDPLVLQPVLRIVAEDTRALKAKVLGLRNSASKGLKSCNSTLQQLSSAMTQLLRIHRRQSQEIDEVRTLYKREALQRKLLYNEVQELRGNIRVFCRCRRDDRGPCALQFDDEDRVICRTSQGRKKVFQFEKVYPPETSQEQVFEYTKPIITSCVDGYNICLIAYGQTGSGKTFTMMGPLEHPGVNVRSMKELFKVCNQRRKVKYTLRVSMVEVYNESVYDVLVPPNEGHEKLQIHRKGKDVIVPGLTEVEVRSMADINMVMTEGEKNRTVADTKMNTNSSRSHLLFMLKVEGVDRISKATSHGRLTLVDLAGSERISRSEATGIRLVEAAAINKSLSALGQVFASIRDGALHIPYRNSKLTHLLQSCIGGDAKACMFVNVSPLEVNVPETISTLEFGENARQVELGKATRHITKATAP